MAKRAYDNSRRQEQSERTREIIVQAMVEAMADGTDDVPVAELAERCGVSRRTVYAHFRDKESRVRAIDEWITEKVQADGLLPTGYDDIPRYVERLVDYIVDNEVLIRAQMSPGLSKSVRSYRKRAHARALRSALREGGHSDRESDRLLALVISLVRAEAVFDLRDIYGRSRTQIKRELRGVVEALLRDA